MSPIAQGKLTGKWEMCKTLVLSLVFILVATTNQVVPVVGVEEPSRITPTMLDTEWQFNLEIPPFGYDSVGGDIEPNTGIYGNLTVTSPVGGLITLGIMDEANYLLYTGGHSAQAYTLLSDATEGSFEFIYPDTGTWFFVAINSGFDTKYATLSFAQDETPPEITVNLANGTSYSGEYTITVTAEDAHFDVEVIRLYIDGVQKLFSYEDTLTYPWDTSDFEPGPHNITITAMDELEKTRSVLYTVTIGQPFSLLLPIAGVSGVVVIGAIALVLFRKRSAE